MHGFGRPRVEENPPVFHAPWEGRTHALLSLILAAGVGNIDKFRHAIERMPPLRYLESSYYERWLTSIETLLVENDVASEEEINEAFEQVCEAGSSQIAEADGDQPSRPRPEHSGALRPLATPPRFKVEDRVRTESNHPASHTRLPRYARGKQGRIGEVYPSFVFPDTNAHDEGESPQYVYSVLFEGAELWGDDAESGTTVSLDLFESYLETVT